MLRIESTSQTDTGALPDSSIAVRIPYSVTVGQLLIACIAPIGTNPLFSPWVRVFAQSGWTALVPLANSTAGGDIAMQIFWKLADANDIDGKLYFFNFQDDGGNVILVAAESSIVSVAMPAVVPFEGVATVNVTTQSATLVSKSFTAATANAVALMFGAITSNGLGGRPPGWSFLFSDSLPHGPNLAAWWQAIPKAGTTIPAASVTSAASGDGLMGVVVLAGS